MNRFRFFALICVVLSPSLFARVADTSDSVKIQAMTAPVIAKSNQPAELANTSAYHVKIADFDSNDDGCLSRREIPAKNALTVEFHRVDRNHNGYITVAELNAANWK